MPVQFTIIDGYNVLHSVGFIRKPKNSLGPKDLAKARQALLGFIARYVDPETRTRTSVVFDANQDVGDLPVREIVNDVEILFAQDYDEADDLIEVLIKRHSAPKQLTVVSSDNRLKTAASRRNAKFIDSETWFDQLRESDPTDVPSQDVISQNESPKSRGNQKLSVEETNHWIDEFNIDSVESFQDNSDVSNKNDQPIHKKDLPQVDREATSDSAGNPFPEDYLNDILRELGENLDDDSAKGSARE